MKSKYEKKFYIKLFFEVNGFRFEKPFIIFLTLDAPRLKRFACGLCFYLFRYTRLSFTESTASYKSSLSALP